MPDAGGHSSSPKATVRRPGTLPLAVTSSPWQSTIAPRAEIRLPSAPEPGGQRGMDRRRANPGDRVDVHHPGLQFGKFGQHGVDRILDRADLGSDFKGSVFDHLFAHDCSFSDAPRAGVVFGLS